MSSLSHRNTTYDELAVGQAASIERPVTANDLYIFAHASGNTNPRHMPTFGADPEADRDIVAPSLWIGSLVSSVLGTILPGAGTLYNGQSFQFRDRARLGDKLTVSVRCIEKRERPHAIFETLVTRQDGRIILEGIAEVEAPRETIVSEHHELPLLLLDQHDHFGRLVERCRRLPPMPTAIVIPDDANSLGGALLAMQKGLIEPILIGSREGRRRQQDRLRSARGRRSRQRSSRRDRDGAGHAHTRIPPRESGCGRPPRRPWRPRLFSPGDRRCGGRRAAGRTGPARAAASAA